MYFRNCSPLVEVGRHLFVGCRFHVVGLLLALAESQSVSPTAPPTAWNNGSISPDWTQVIVSFNFTPKQSQNMIFLPGAFDIGPKLFVLPGSSTALNRFIFV